MHICPQCNTEFAEDIIYCMNDGNLLASDKEQETVIRKKTFVADVKSGIRVDLSTICPKCQVANPATSKFCNKCGSSLTDEEIPHEDAGAIAGTSGAPTITIPNPGELPPPNVPVNPNPPQKNNQMKIVVALIACFLLIFAIWGFANMSGKKGENATSFTDVETNGSDSEDSDDDDNSEGDKSGLPKTFDREYDGKMGGKRLSMSLKRDGEKLTGEASTTRTDTLDGTIEDSGEFTLKGYENGTNHTGIYSGKIDGASITGKWTTIYRTKPRSFYLTKK